MWVCFVFFFFLTPKRHFVYMYVSVSRSIATVYSMISEMAYAAILFALVRVPACFPVFLKAAIEGGLAISSGVIDH